MSAAPGRSPIRGSRDSQPVHHGGIDTAELERLGLAPDAVLDFSVNSNPAGPSPSVRAAVAATPLDRYPDRDCHGLRRALGQRLGIPPERIVAGNGTAELIWLVALAFLRPGDRILVVGPTFGEYERAASLVGAPVTQWRVPLDVDPATAPGVITESMAAGPHRAVFLCNPNNPTGWCLPPGHVAAWAADHPDTLFVIDEAYVAFVDGPASVIPTAPPNVLVLRSMTKDYALAGLRLGYAVGSEALVRALADVRPAWNVNALAQAAGIAALADEAWYASTLGRLRAETAFLRDGLLDLGLVAGPSRTQFFLLPVGDGTAFRARLLQKGILVRDCASFGLPGHVRISPRLRPENERLLAAVARLAWPHDVEVAGVAGIPGIARVAGVAGVAGESP
jgi:histidinol-phosphate aminotransferase